MLLCRWFATGCSGIPKRGIVKVVAPGSGLKPEDPIACQPLKTAWRLAEASHKAALEAKARGEEVSSNDALGWEQRQRVDKSVLEYYHFTWPPTFQGSDGLLGKLGKFF